MTVIDATGGSPASPRLLLISSEFPPGPGGIGTHAYQIARHLTRLGWRLKVVTPQAYVSPSERDDFNSKQLFPIQTLPERANGPLWWLKRMSMVVSAVRSFHPDLVMATGRRSLWMASTLQPFFGFSWVAIGHGSEFKSRSRWSEQLTRIAIRQAKAIIAVSTYTADLIRSLATPRKLIVIPNAADGERFRPGIDNSTIQKKWHIQESQVLLTVGQVSERKAQDVIIRALPQVLQSNPDVLYIMAGLPSREPEFAALAAELGVTHHVRFAGVIPESELPHVYNLADLFVLVSRQTQDGDVEGYGIVIQEAALCGVPAVVSRDCGLTEAIREGVTGLSVPPDDPEATAGTIIKLLADDKQRKEMGRRARELAVATTWTERAAEYDRVLRSCLKPEVNPT